MTDKWWLVDDEILGILLANILRMIIIQKREFTTNQFVLHTVWAGVLPSQPLGLFFYHKPLVLGTEHCLLFQRL